MLNYRNFIAFSVVSLVQTFHCHFNSNFFPLFLSYLLGDSVSPQAASFLLGLSFLMPHLNNLYFGSLSEKYGVYNVIGVLIIAKLLLAGVLLITGSSSIFLLGLFILSNRVFTEGTCKLLSLVTSDLVDEDYIIHHRKQAVSALIFGSTNLISKAGQSLAPVLGTWLLVSNAAILNTFSSSSSSTFSSTELELPSLSEELINSASGVDSSASIISSIEKFSHETAQRLMLNMLICVPVCSALIQLIAWKLFTLHGSRLAYIKQAIVSKESDSAPAAIFST